jgi:hypothetical protein
MDLVFFSSSEIFRVFVRLEQDLDAARSALRKVLHRDLEGERKLIQGAIDRPFILPELLKSDPNCMRELFLGYASF